jgi:hypothetical protein
MAEASVSLTLYDAEPKNPAVTHKFFATAQTAHFEYGFLGKIKQMVERQITRGIPPHRRPSARDRRLVEGQSSIFVVEWNEFDKMGASEIQDIFRHRHILVRNWPEKTLEFDWDGLSLLGPMQKDACFQGEFVKLVENLFNPI